MTNPVRASADSQRDSLRARIEAAERRNAERSLADDARKAAEAAADYARAHPLTVIGGALAVGLTIGLMTRPGRRVAQQVVSSASGAVSGAASSATSGVKSLTARGGSKLGLMLGEAAVAYIMTLVDEALDNARAGQDRAEDLGEAASGQARKLRDSAVQAIRDLTNKTKG